GLGCKAPATCNNKNRCVTTPSSSVTPAAPQASPGDPDSKSKIKGEPGDVGGDGSGDAHDKGLSDAPAKAKTASSGCRAAPTPAGDRGAMLGLALLVAAVLTGRRRTKRV